MIVSKSLNINSPTSDIFKIAFRQSLALYYLINEKFDEFESIVVSHLIPSLKDYKSFYEMGYFYNELGNVYYKQKFFEKSATVLKESQKAFRNLITFR